MKDVVAVGGVMPADKHGVVIELENGRHYVLNFEQMLSHLMCLQQKRLLSDRAGAKTPPNLT